MRTDFQRHRPSATTTRFGNAVIAILLGFAAAGCQGGVSPGSTGLKQVASVAEIDRLISSTLTPEEQSVLVNAHGSVVETCMQKLGWDFRVTIQTPEDAQGGPRSMTKFEQWTFSNVAFAQASGFDMRTYMRELNAFMDHMKAGSGTAHIPEPDLMTPDERARLELEYFGRDDERIEITERDGSHTSIPGGGCLGEAEHAIYGADIELKLRLEDARTSIESDIWSGTLSTEAVAVALAKWKTCVARSGDTFETPPDVFEAAFDAAHRGDYETEQRVAVLLAQCSTETGLADAINVAFLAAGNALIPELEDDLVALQQFEEDALTRAKVIFKVWS